MLWIFLKMNNPTRPNWTLCGQINCTTAYNDKRVTATLRSDSTNEHLVASVCDTLDDNNTIHLRTCLRRMMPALHLLLLVGGMLPNVHCFPDRTSNGTAKEITKRSVFTINISPSYVHEEEEPHNFGELMTFVKPNRQQSNLFTFCSNGSKCQFFLYCYLSGGSLGTSCGPLFSCCVKGNSQERKIKAVNYGPVRNDPYCGRNAVKTSRIVGGNDASFGQFPWQALIQVGGSRCGGALVGRRHVVTAGHCVARSQHNPSNIRVTLGDFVLHSNIESLPTETIGVSQVKLHPNFRFTPQADRFDVAVLILKRAAPYRANIKPICLPRKNAKFLGRTAYAAGWGAVQPGSKLRPKTLQYVGVPIIENKICETWHKKRGINIRIHDEMMCAGYERGGRDACQGDSGGPLMMKEYNVWYLIGIVSAGYSCAKQHQPGIYHRVSSSSDWISSNLF